MTRHFLSLFTLAVTGWLATPCVWGADATNPAPDFKEVYDLLRTNLTGATDDNLNRAAIEGLLSRFPGKVSLVGGAADGSATPPDGSALSKSAIIENNVAYLRVGHVTGNLANELTAAYRALTASNKVAGLVLDLRFVVGDDAASAQAAANLFASKKIAAGSLVVLVNAETRGAAETLAAALRHAGAGLIIGNPTAGEAATFKEFPLRNGERLRIAMAPAKSGNGLAVPSGGLQPDIAVTVSADDERAFWENPYASPAQNNKPRGCNQQFTAVCGSHQRGGIGAAEAERRETQRGAPPAGHGFARGQPDPQTGRQRQPERKSRAGAGGGTAKAGDSRPGSGARGGFDQRTRRRAPIAPLISD